ncbi:hypothetical protein HRbin21_01251 [bacterium HR21]|nr:hypothetical protein HRbin21_01251 [bacterium HR21]
MRSVRKLGSLLLLVLLWGCAKEESSTGPGTAPNYFPLAVGNWWVSTTVQLDTNGNVVAGTESRDSMVIVAQTQLEGRTGFVAVTHHQNGTTDTTVLSASGGKLYLYFHAPQEVESPFDLLTGWVLWIDATQAQWTTASVSDTLEGVELRGMRGTLMMQLTIRGSRGGTTSVTIAEKNQTVQAQEFVHTLQIQGTFVPEGQSAGIPVQLTQTVRSWFAGNIGQVRSRQEPSALTAQLPPPLPPWQEKFGGEQSVLVNYRVQ